MFSSYLWIANFGVDPLFLSAAFLLRPAVLVFNLLLDLVCVVFDAIGKSLFIQFIKINRPVYLLYICLFVKAFSQPAFAGNSTRDVSEVIISVGESYPLEITSVKEFSIANKEVIRAKLIKNELRVKGLKIGISDILVWDTKNQLKTWRFFITSKKEQLEEMELTRALRGSDLEIQHAGKHIVVKGVVKRLSDYRIIMSLSKQSKYQLLLELDPNLRNEIIAEVYKESFGNQIHYINCHPLGMEIICNYRGDKDASVLNLLSKKYLIQFNHRNSFKQINYSIEYKIIQIENHHGLSIGTGLNKISATLSEILNNGAGISENEVLLEEANTTASLLARPQALIVINEKHSIQMGAEIPYQYQKDQATLTHWRFAGLKVESTISEDKGSLFLNYKTEFTRPVQQAVSGTKGSGKIKLDLDSFYQIFELGFEIDEEVVSSLPGLGKIPILKYLFMSTQSQKSFKQIIAFIKVTKKGTHE